MQLCAGVAGPPVAAARRGVRRPAPRGEAAPQSAGRAGATGGRSWGFEPHPLEW